MLAKENNQIDSLEVVIVTFFPRKEKLSYLLDSIEAASIKARINPIIHIWDNTTDYESAVRVDNYPKVSTIDSTGENIGYGAGVNKTIKKIKNEVFMVLNQDAFLDENSIVNAKSHMQSKKPDHVVFELAHRPSEHPKEYDPVSLETPWFSGAAFFIKKEIFISVGGFDERLFLYGEDVDLSIKIRAAGKKIIYMTNSIVYHDDGENTENKRSSKPLFDKANNFLLRIKYGSFFNIALYPFLLITEYLLLFWKGDRFLLTNTLRHVFNKIPAYLMERGGQPSKKNIIKISKWRYARHRAGGFIKIEKTDSCEKVSVIIRTKNRPELLISAIKSINNQTYLKLEVVLVNDGDADLQGFVRDNLREDVNLVYRNSNGMGRSIAANIGLESANGDWICFLDDDDQFYGDHIETIVGFAKSNNYKIAYALAEEVKTDEKHNQIKDPKVKYNQRYSKVLLWYKNYLPIQSVIFHKDVFRQLGGFDETLDLYEDWSLWIKYSTVFDFGFIEKATSKYFVKEKSTKLNRNRAFQDIYPQVASKHQYEFQSNVIQSKEMIKEYLRQRCILCITKEQIFDLVIKAREFFQRKF